MGALHLQEVGFLQRRPNMRFEVLEGVGAWEAFSRFPQPLIREAKELTEKKTPKISITELSGPSQSSPHPGLRDY